MSRDTLPTRVRQLNRWISEMLLALAPILMTVGLVAGATDLLLGGYLANVYWFQLGWSLTQAIAIDSMFVIVANAFHNTTNKKEKRLFGVLSLLYGGAAFIVTTVQSYEQLGNVSASQAMTALHIEPQVFADVRSALVIATVFLYYLVERQTRTHVPDDVEQLEINEPPISVIEVEPEIQIPQTAQSLEERAFDIIAKEPSIGPTALGRRVGVDRAKAFRLRKKYASVNSSSGQADGMEEG